MQVKTDMSGEDSLSTKVLALVRTLAPATSRTQEDIGWAEDLSAGKALFQWIADQLSHEDVEASERLNRAAVQEIALDEEEAICAKVKNTNKVSSTEGPQVMLGTPPAYVSPSVLNTRSQFLEQEAELLEEEARLLKHRMKVAKQVSKHMVQTAQSLRKAIRSVDADLAQEQERLSQSSLDVDACVAKCKDLSVRLLRTSTTAVPGVSELHGTVSDLKIQLSSLLTRRSKLVDLAEEHLRSVDESAQRLPTTSEIEQEAARLQKGFEELKATATDASGDNAALLVDASYTLELRKLCDQFESVAQDKSANPLEKIFAQAKASEHSNDRELADPFVLDVIQEINRGWKLDQAALLAVREQVLAQISTDFEVTLLPPMCRVEKELSEYSDRVLQADALINALLEELEDVTEGIAGARKAPSFEGRKAREAEARGLLDTELVELLKRLHKEHGDDRVLVLLDRQDLINELDGIDTRFKAANDVEERWAAELPGKLSELKRGPASSLAAEMYANSPVNTSPPFVPSQAQAALESKMKRKADQLSDAVKRSQKDSELSSRDMRKLDAFVNKWARS